MNKPCTILALFKAKPGKELELKKILMSLIEPTKKEAGCLDYTLHCDPNNPGSFMFYENFIHEGALAEHKNKPYMRALPALVNDLLAEPYEVSIWHKL